MAVASAVANSQGASQLVWQQIKLQQAQRNADQAEQNAQALKAQAAQAERVADRADERARSLKVQSDQAQTQAGMARSGLAAIRSEERMGVRLADTYDRTVQRQNAQVTTNKADGELAVGGSRTGQAGDTVMTGTTVNVYA
jgi:hypothetical protein